MSKTAETTEQEWQFSAAGLDLARDWIARQPAEYSVRRFAPRATLEIDDTYFDSADWMIFRAGFALRLRQAREDAGDARAELTLKALRPARDGFAQRTEITEAVPSADLGILVNGTTALAERVRALVGARALAPLFHAHTRRERQQLLEADTELPLAEVDLDHTLLQTPNGATRELTRVEVECLNAEPAVLEPLVERLRIAAHLEPANESKFRAGLDIAGLEPAGPWSAPTQAITASMPFDAAVPRVLGRYFTTVVHSEPAVRLGSVEAVHEMRVAARHLDVLLKAFANQAPRWAVRTRRVVRALVKALGAVRDCDVQIAWLDGSGEPATTIEPLRSRLETERRAARTALLGLLDAADTRDWIESWRRELEAAASREHAPAGQATNGDATRRPVTAIAARKLIHAQARKLRKRARRIGVHSNADDYHEVRIRAKRLRYTLGPFAELYGDAGREYLKALAKLQTVLGNHHDANVRADRFGALAANDLPATASFALGRLVERDAGTLQDQCAKFSKAWRRLRKRRWRALEAAMKDAAIGP